MVLYAKSQPLTLSINRDGKREVVRHMGNIYSRAAAIKAVKVQKENVQSKGRLRPFHCEFVSVSMGSAGLHNALCDPHICTLSKWALV